MIMMREHRISLTLTEINITIIKKNRRVSHRRMRINHSQQKSVEYVLEPRNHLLDLVIAEAVWEMCIQNVLSNG